jgi:hypothetical protein
METFRSRFLNDALLPLPLFYWAKHVTGPSLLAVGQRSSLFPGKYRKRECIFVVKSFNLLQIAWRKVPWSDKLGKCCGFFLKSTCLASMRHWIPFPAPNIKI